MCGNFNSRQFVDWIIDISVLSQVRLRVLTQFIHSPPSIQRWARSHFKENAIDSASNEQEELSNSL
jgi:hypothetical protein